jgi:hypothetical protein
MQKEIQKATIFYIKENYATPHENKWIIFPKFKTQA